MASPSWGRKPAELNVLVIIGDPWEEFLVLEENGVPIAWPAPPVLEFGKQLGQVDGQGDPIPPLLVVTGVLTADAETSTPNSMSTWSITEDQVRSLPRGMPLRIEVDGDTIVKGVVQCLS